MPGTGAWDEATTTGSPVLAVAALGEHRKAVMSHGEQLLTEKLLAEYHHDERADRVVGVVEAHDR